MQRTSVLAMVVLAGLNGCTCRETSTKVRALIVTEPLSLDFGTLQEGRSAELTLTVRNDGRARLTVSSLDVTGDTRTAFEVLDTLDTLEAGGFAELRVLYTAPAGDGVDGAFITIQSNAENSPTLQVGLRGRSSASCVPETDAELCFRLGKNCGPASADDNCGVQRAVVCGSCTSPQTCGAVTPGVCGCVAESDGAFCTREGKNCGQVSGLDNCGATRVVASCGLCLGTDVCGAMTPNVCGCVPESNLQFCARQGKNCDSLTAADNCGASRTVGCGTCVAPESCGAITANVCGCIAQTDAQLCAAAAKNCGTWSTTDNCNRARPSVNCGSCASGDTCGAVTPNVCTCVPETDTVFCSRQGKNCGSLSGFDNCGTARNNVSCGSCTSPQSCGAVTPNVCGCVPETDASFCSRQGRVCGPATGLDNCNVSRNVSSCGTCTPPPNGASICTGAGTCDFTCNSTFHKCSNACCTAVAAIRAGTYRTCSLDQTGQVLCWGGPPIGNGTSSGNTLTPVSISGVPGATLVGASQNFSCANAAGGLSCWGTNAEGELGDNTTTQRLSPVPVYGSPGSASDLSLGRYHACAVTLDGGAKCWGYNDRGQLGDGTVGQRNAPVNVSGLTSDVLKIGAGAKHSCAVLTDGGVRCWGSNLWGELGDGTNVNKLVPVNVVGLPSASSAVALGDSFTCALVSPPGAVWCWGANGYGQLGDGTNTYRGVPAVVSGLTGGIDQISAMNNHACAVTSAGETLCWGMNNYGQLGTGGTSNQSTPVVVVGLDGGTSAVSAGGDHSCALRTDGVAVCWGGNVSGQLGIGNTTTQLTPTPVTGL